MSALEDVTGKMSEVVVTLIMSTERPMEAPARGKFRGMSGMFIDVDDNRAQCKDERLGAGDFEGVEFMFS